MFRHRFRLTTALLALLVLATGCSSASGAATATGFTLRVGFISTTPNPSGPEGWLNRDGTLLTDLKSAGVGELKWVPFKNGPDLSAAISGGSLDLAILGDTPALTARANGIQTRLVNQTSVGSDTWLYGAKGVTSLEQLKGKTIATQVGSYMYRYLVALLQQAGLADSVTISHVYTTAAVASLTSGGIAAYAAPAGQLTAALDQAGFPLIDKASADHKDLLGSSVTVITSKALASHPSLPSAWNAARAQGVQAINANPDAYYAFAANATGTTADVVKVATPISSYPSEAFTASGLALLQGTDQFLADNKLAKSAVDLDTWKVS